MVDFLEISLCDKSTFSVLKQLIDVAKSFQTKKQNDPESMMMMQPTTNEKSPLINYMEAFLFHACWTSIGVRIAGVDLFVDSSTSRGIDFRLQEVAFDFRGSRASIDPVACCNERIKLGLTTDDCNYAQYDTVTGGLLRGLVREIKLTPILAIWDKELFQNTTPLLNIPEIEIQSNLLFQDDHEMILN